MRAPRPAGRPHLVDPKLLRIERKTRFKTIPVDVVPTIARDHHTGVLPTLPPPGFGTSVRTVPGQDTACPRPCLGSGQSRGVDQERESACAATHIRHDSLAEGDQPAHGAQDSGPQQSPDDGDLSQFHQRAHPGGVRVEVVGKGRGFAILSTGRGRLRIAGPRRFGLGVSAGGLPGDLRPLRPREPRPERDPLHPPRPLAGVKYRRLLGVAAAIGLNLQAVHGRSMEYAP